MFLFLITPRLLQLGYELDDEQLDTLFWRFKSVAEQKKVSLIITIILSLHLAQVISIRRGIFIYSFRLLVCMIILKVNLFCLLECFIWLGKEFFILFHSFTVVADFIITVWFSLGPKKMKKKNYIKIKEKHVWIWAIYKLCICSGLKVI